MNRFLPVLLLSALLFPACSGPITVNSDDRTPPSLSVTLASARNLDAQYTDDDAPIDGAIDPTRPFEVTPRRDQQAIQLIFAARDAESGISQLRTSLDISFTCRTSVFGGPVQAEKTTTISEDFLDRTPAGEETSPLQTVLVQFSYEDLWRRGNCTTWDDVVDVASGRLTDIEVSYSASAQNNAVPPGSPASLSGQFSVADGRVDIGS